MFNEGQGSCQTSCRTCQIKQELCGWALSC